MTSCESGPRPSNRSAKGGKAALDRARSQCGRAISIDAEKIDVFARLMIDKLENGDVNGRKAYIRALISAIEVGDKTVRIIGCKDVLQAVVAGKQTANENVRGVVRKWRAIQNKTANSYVLEISI
jgi:site-specific DNA recombinase